MRKFNFKNSIVVGGILDFNENNILLRKRLIEDGLMIHSCNDYYRSLEIIKKASSEQKDRLKLLTKKCIINIQIFTIGDLDQFMIN